MIGMSIPSIWPKGDYHVGPDAAQVSDDLGDHFGGMGRVQVAIYVVQKLDAVQTEDISGCPYLGLAHFRQNLQSWILALFTGPTTLATSRDHEMKLDPLCCVLRQHAAIAERFVVGMGQDCH